MNLREAIHIHMQHARVKLKAMKQLEMAKQTRNLHRVKSARAHSQSASRLENRLASRNKEAAARFRMTKSETRRKLFDEQLLKDSENMETIGLLERVQSTNTISPKKSSMRNIATKVTAHNNAKK
jgi:23S rRNA maturation mini-RNase III